MFYFLSKLAGYFLTPAGWLLALLLGSIVFRRFRRRFLLAALALFWLLGSPFMANEVARAWEVSSQTTLPPRPAGDTLIRVAVVLTGALTNTHLPVMPARPMLSNQGDRLGQALYLYKTGQVQKILISGGSGNLFFVAKELKQEGQQGMAFLQLAGVPAQDLLWEARSRNTRENALFSARLLQQRFKTNECVLVTSAFHLRRATACFAKVGIRATPFPAAFLQQPRVFEPGDLLPHEQAFTDTMHLLREMAGYVSYALAGYL